MSLMADWDDDDNTLRTHMASDEVDHDLEMGLVSGLPETGKIADGQIELQSNEKPQANGEGDHARHAETEKKVTQTFTITKTISSRGKIKLVTKTRPRLSNNLLVAVGFLDLASACDFPANIWNDYPVPIYADVFMVLGGTIALTIACFAIKDFRLSHLNYILLRSERRLLKKRRLEHLQKGHLITSLDSCLELNFRELGNEIARLGMDAVMGFGVFLVGIGTLMALGGGRSHRVYHASNLLSGYIGNAPIAFYGLMNSAWSIYLWRKTHEHSCAARKYLKGRPTIQKLVERRTRLVSLYSALYGVAGFFTGVGSLISATMWFGYVISFPWIFTSVFCNWLWRRRIGYDRSAMMDMGGVFFTKESVIGDIDEMFLYKSKLSSSPPNKNQNRSIPTTLSAVVLSSKTLDETLQFLIKYDLFDDFCYELSKDESLRVELVGDFDETGECTINSTALAQVDYRYHERLLALAMTVVDEFGLVKFRQRKRFLVEDLGCFLCAEEPGRSENG